MWKKCSTSASHTYFTCASNAYSLTNTQRPGSTWLKCSQLLQTLWSTAGITLIIIEHRVLQGQCGKLFQELLQNQGAVHSVPRLQRFLGVFLDVWPLAVDEAVGNSARNLDPLQLLAPASAHARLTVLLFRWPSKQQVSQGHLFLFWKRYCIKCKVCCSGKHTNVQYTDRLFFFLSWCFASTETIRFTRDGGGGGGMG